MSKTLIDLVAEQRKKDDEVNFPHGARTYLLRSEDEVYDCTQMMLDMFLSQKMKGETQEQAKALNRMQVALEKRQPFVLAREIESGGTKVHGYKIVVAANLAPSVRWKEKREKPDDQGAGAAP